MIWLTIGVGGALGSMARHAVNVMSHHAFRDAVPYATAIVNVVGCFAIGLLAGLVASETWRLGVTARSFVFVGILGGFTTFSSLGLDTLTLVRSGALGSAFANVAAQVVIGLASVFAGYWLAR